MSVLGTNRIHIRYSRKTKSKFFIYLFIEFNFSSVFMSLLCLFQHNLLDTN